MICFSFSLEIFIDFLEKEKRERLRILSTKLLENRKSPGKIRKDDLFKKKDIC